MSDEHPDDPANRCEAAEDDSAHTLLTETALTPLEFMTRKTGLIATVTLTLTNRNGETFHGEARSDIHPGYVGHGFARLAGTAARLLNASAGDQFQTALTGLEEDLKNAAKQPGNKE